MVASGLRGPGASVLDVQIGSRGGELATTGCLHELGELREARNLMERLCAASDVRAEEAQREAEATVPLAIEGRARGRHGVHAEEVLCGTCRISGKKSSGNLLLLESASLR